MCAAKIDIATVRLLTIEELRFGEEFSGNLDIGVYNFYKPLIIAGLDALLRRLSAGTGHVSSFNVTPYVRPKRTDSLLVRTDDSKMSRQV